MRFFRWISHNLRHHRARSALFLFLLLRLSLIAITIRFPEGAALIDSRAYMTFASTIIQGATYTDLNSPPGYPLFIAFASGWSDPSFVRTVFSQLVLTSLIAWMLLVIGSKLSNERVGLIAGWLYALSPNASLWALTIMTETLFTFFIVLALWAWLAATDTGRLRSYFAIGIFLGLGAMVRNIGLMLIPVWVIFHMIQKVFTKELGTAMITGLAILIGSAIVILPWAIHNQVVHGEFMVTEEHSRTFFTFNVASVLAVVEGISRDQAAVEMGRTEDPFGLTLELLVKHPLAFIEVQAKGILRSMFGVSTGAWARVFGYPLELQGSFQLLGKIQSGDLPGAIKRLGELLADGRSIVLLVLTILGIGHSVLLYILSLGLFFRGELKAWALALIVVTAMLLIISPGSVGQARFRIPAEPLLVVTAAIGWNQFRRSRSVRQYKCYT